MKQKDGFQVIKEALLLPIKSTVFFVLISLAIFLFTLILYIDLKPTITFLKMLMSDSTSTEYSIEVAESIKGIIKLVTIITTSFLVLILVKFFDIIHQVSKGDGDLAISINPFSYSTPVLSINYIILMLFPFLLYYALQLYVNNIYESSFLLLALSTIRYLIPYIFILFLPAMAGLLLYTEKLATSFSIICYIRFIYHRIGWAKYILLVMFYLLIYSVMEYILLSSIINLNQGESLAFKISIIKKIPITFAISIIFVSYCIFSSGYIIGVILNTSAREAVEFRQDSNIASIKRENRWLFDVQDTYNRGHKGDAIQLTKSYLNSSNISTKSKSELRVYLVRILQWEKSLSKDSKEFRNEVILKIVDQNPDKVYQVKDILFKLIEDGDITIPFNHALEVANIAYKNNNYNAVNKITTHFIQTTNNHSDIIPIGLIYIKVLEKRKELEKAYKLSIMLQKKIPNHSLQYKVKSMSSRLKRKLNK